MADAENVTEEAAPERVGDYVIERLLGEGGMAKVYLARHAILDTRHAVKVLEPSYRVNPEARQRFLDEAKIQASHLDHPNIVKVTNIVATTEHAALVMELIDGQSLEALLGTLKEDPAEIRRIMFAVLDAVGYAHDAGIIHRDLKPANVLLANKDGQWFPKVTDFGIAKVTGGATAKKSTHAEARMGTLTYSSPEQFRRAKDATARSDVFSLGAMLYEMATGAPAFAGDSDYDVMDDIVHGRYTPPEHCYDKIDPVIASVIKKALQADAANRFASCKDMAAALRCEAPAVHVEPVPSASSSPVADPIAERTPERRRAGLWIALGVAAVAAASVVYVMRERPEKEPTAEARAPSPSSVSADAAASIDATELVAAVRETPILVDAGPVDQAASVPPDAMPAAPPMSVCERTARRRVAGIREWVGRSCAAALLASKRAFVAGAGKTTVRCAMDDGPAKAWIECSAEYRTLSYGVDRPSGASGMEGQDIQMQTRYIE